MLGAPALALGLAALPYPAVSQPAASTQGAAPEQFRRVRDRMRADAVAESGPGPAAEVLARQAADGSWADVDYADQGIGNWRPMLHLERLRRMARALAEPSPPAPAGQLAAGLGRGLQYWLDRKPRSENWWHNTIGQQRELVRILLLSPGVLAPALRAQALAQLVDPTMVPPDQATGQNRVWYATQQLVRGAVGEQAADLAAGSAALASTLRITLDEGIQPDWSFHQHGPQLYSGGYGLGFIGDVAQVAAWLNGTPWAFEGEALALLADFGLQGIAPLVRGPWLDWSARGREFTRPEHRPPPQLLGTALARLAPLLPPQRKQLVDSAVQALQRSEPPALGTRAYWRSDFLVHHTREAYFSLKMSSARTVGTESGNGENLQGFWLPFGVTYLLKRGDEYDGLPPVWDWSALPGLTAPAVVPAFKGYQRHDARFVGALAEGSAAVAAMNLDKNGIRAQQAWFFIDGLMVAMGCGISCNQPQPVWTTLNQCRLRGAVHTPQGRVREGNEPLPPGTRWLWHDGLTYLLDEGSEPTLTRGMRTGRRAAINTAVGTDSGAADVMLLRIAHGLMPRDARYVYGVWAGASSPEQAAQAPAFQALHNLPALQALRAPDGVQTLAVLRAAGEVDLGSGLRLRISAPCLLWCSVQGSRVKVRVADPTRTAGSIEVGLYRAAVKVREARLSIASDLALPYWAGTTLEP